MDLSRKNEVKVISIRLLITFDEAQKVFLALPMEMASRENSKNTNCQNQDEKSFNSSILAHWCVR
jgi:hypothetical protein